MSKGYWIDKFSDEYNIVFSNVSANLSGNLHIANLQIWKIDNPLLRNNFDHQNASTLQVQSWMNTKDIFRGSEQDILSAIHGGFAFPAGTKGMKFGTNHLDGLDTGSKADPDKVHGFIMCVLAIGRSFVVGAADQNIDIPENFDSLYISDNNSPGKK